MIELGIAYKAKIGPIGRGSDWAKGEPAFRRWEAHFSTNGRREDGIKQLVLRIGVDPPETVMFDSAIYEREKFTRSTLQVWYWREA